MARLQPSRCEALYVAILFTVVAITLSDAQTCDPPLFLEPVSGSCVETCPPFHTADSGSRNCTAFPLEFMALPTATIFSVEIATANPNGATVTIPFTLVLDRDYFGSQFPGPGDIILQPVDPGVCTINGMSNRFYFLGDTALTVFSDAVYGPVISIMDDLMFMYPSNLIPGAHNCSVGITLEPGGRNFVRSPFFIGSVIYQPDPCDPQPCMNNGVCSIDGLTFTCSCDTDYTGLTCETPLNSCTIEPCQNGGTCFNLGNSDFMCSCPPDTNGTLCEKIIDDCEFPALIDCNNNGICIDGNQTFSCDCNIGFTGNMCAAEIDECLGSGCLNGLCIDLVNGYNCSCFPGWTGRDCDSRINYCVGDPLFGPCHQVGSVSCGNGNDTFICSCVIGFNGTLCETDIDDCVNNPCGNGGTCTDRPFGIVECNCGAGFSGPFCEVEVNPCDTLPCVNNGSCTDVGMGNYTCNCTEGFTGTRCEVDIDVCTDSTCQNGGICSDGIGASFSCMCMPGHTGTVCEDEIIFCTNTTCMNGGECMDEAGVSVRCNCLTGFTGQACEVDVDFCNQQSCMNGGACMEGIGTATSCNCTAGFSGSICEIDEDFCSISSCENGGTCVEGVGPATSCNCTEGYSGSRCEVDEVFCSISSCENGGTCLEGVGPATSCNCTEGYSGSRCEVDEVFCSISSCENGGTCIEGIGPATSCNCSEGFTGNRCEIDSDFCTSSTCQNGGMCIEGLGPATSCNCTEGYGGTNCENDLDFCQFRQCQNNGTCGEGIGSATSCACSPRYSGEDCEMDLCDSLTCLNGGTCEEGANIVQCRCLSGFNGDTCEEDLPFCQFSNCTNGGVCVEGNGMATSCNCTEGFSGPQCENDDDFCHLRTCQNGGTCMDGLGSSTMCVCSPGFTGTDCEMALCDSLICLNDGFCQVTANGAECNCTLGFRGQLCEEDLDFCDLSDPTCMNGGVCIDGYGPAVTCNCTDGFSGDQCEIDDEFCFLRSCLNGGICMERVGPITMCSCSPRYTGEDCEVDMCASLTCQNGGFCQETDSGVECNCSIGFRGSLCEEDIDFCGSTSCQNSGTCIEGRGTSISCNCTEGFSGDQCENDGSFCHLRSCQNGGTCMEGVGPITMCSCRPRYTGVDCEVDMCASLACQNGGLCLETDIGVECNCTAGFRGGLCEEDLGFCDTDSCDNGGTCVEGTGTLTSCNCTEGFSGDRCERDDDFCHRRTCQNGGTCMEGTGSITTCSCTPRYTGEDCEVDMCDSLPCQNGGFCQGTDTGIECNCPSGFRGSVCEEDLDFCQNISCQSGTCVEGYGTNTSCNCTEGFSGDLCENDDDFCHTRNCANGGTCEDGVGASTSCTCVIGFTGENCELLIDCRLNSDCPTNFFCEIMCPSDNYSNTYTTLLSEPLTLRGVSFLSVPESRRPRITADISIFAVFRQEPDNRGYIFFYGTSPESRNLAILIDATVTQSQNSTRPGVYVYYTSTQGNMSRLVAAHTMSVTDNATHTVVATLSTSTNPGSARVFLDGQLIGETVHILRDADLQHNVSDSNPAVTFVGARLQRNFRFVGEIGQVVVFNSVLTRVNVSDLHAEYTQLLQPRGTCSQYSKRNDNCPTPRVSSLLCQSVYNLCEPGLACLPDFDDQYTCQPLPVECSSDKDCQSDYLCGSALPGPDKSQYDNPGANIAGDVVFLQRDAMKLDGYSVISLPVSSLPPLMTDLTIFATVCQERGNDGYIIGKGINDRMRDFGLYLRSSMRTVWLAYGASNTSEGFQYILFFYNVSVADGSCHSVAAVIDSIGDKAVLYIDGKAEGISSPLPGIPNFRPNFNFFYVGGRPSTRHFRFEGTISNLFVGSSALPPDTLSSLHRQALTSNGIEPLSLSNSSVRYCYARRTLFEQCYADSFANNNFKCESSSQCVPSFSNSESSSLPEQGDSFRIAGRCVNPCSTCSTEENPQCGEDGRTYQNRCFLDCVNVQFLHTGRCLNYGDLYSLVQGTNIIS